VPVSHAKPASSPTVAQVLANLRRAHNIAEEALRQGRHPFGAILVAADHQTVLLSQGNVDVVNHAESVLAREAAKRYTPAQLWECTLYTTVEPCAMCAGTQYWANIGRVVFGLSEQRLLQITRDHAENPTLNLPCREVFGRGQKAIEIIGPVADIENEVAALHQRFWLQSAHDEGGGTIFSSGIPEL